MGPTSRDRDGGPWRALVRRSALLPVGPRRVRRPRPHAGAGRRVGAARQGGPAPRRGRGGRRGLRRRQRRARAGRDPAAPRHEDVDTADQAARRPPAARADAAPPDVHDRRDRGDLRQRARGPTTSPTCSTGSPRSTPSCAATSSSTHDARADAAHGAARRAADLGLLTAQRRVLEDRLVAAAQRAEALHAAGRCRARRRRRARARRLVEEERAAAEAAGRGRSPGGAAFDVPWTTNPVPADSLRRRRPGHRRGSRGSGDALRGRRDHRRPPLARYALLRRRRRRERSLAPAGAPRRHPTTGAPTTAPARPTSTDRVRLLEPHGPDLQRGRAQPAPDLAPAVARSASHVAMSDLQPGDLLFWAYNTANPASIHHVALYIGHGLMVHSPHTGDHVTRRVGLPQRPHRRGPAGLTARRPRPPDRRGTDDATACGIRLYPGDREHPTSDPPAASSPRPDTVVLDRYRLVDRVGDTAGHVAVARRRPAPAPAGGRAVHAAGQRPGRPAARGRARARRSSRTDARSRCSTSSPTTDAGQPGRRHRVAHRHAVRASTSPRSRASRCPRATPRQSRSRWPASSPPRRRRASPHAHVRPSAVMITDTGEVRVRGLGVDRALYGVEPELDPELADVHGAGAILYAGLTGRWPGRRRCGPDARRALARRGGRIPWPSRVVADVPPDARRDRGARPAHHQAAQGRRRTSPRSAEVVAALDLRVVAPVVAPRADRGPAVDGPRLGDRRWGAPRAASAWPPRRADALRASAAPRSPCRARRRTTAAAPSARHPRGATARRRRARPPDRVGGRLRPVRRHQARRTPSRPRTRSTTTPRRPGAPCATRRRPLRQARRRSAARPRRPASGLGGRACALVGNGTDLSVPHIGQPTTSRRQKFKLDGRGHRRRQRAHAAGAGSGHHALPRSSG